MRHEWIGRGRRSPAGMGYSREDTSGDIWERQARASVSLARSEPANSRADGLQGDDVNDFQLGIVDSFSRRR